MNRFELVKGKKYDIAFYDCGKRWYSGVYCGTVKIDSGIAHNFSDVMGCYSAIVLDKDFEQRIRKNENE